jgi:two-component system chemotaxis response regulator CheB
MEGQKNIRGQNRDIIVVGASAGGVEPLKFLVDSLPAGFPGAIFIVLHLGATSHLSEILGSSSHLVVTEAADDAPIERGTVYVATPNRHLLLHERHMLLRRGPRENGFRPGIDPLFRSAAVAFGGRVIGVILSGALNDGAVGLSAIQRCGGIAVIQDPADATISDMPEFARKSVDIDYCLPVRELPDLLIRLTNEPAGKTPEIPFDIRFEASIAAQEPQVMTNEKPIGKPAGISCPECQGPLWEVTDDSILRYRCHVGHAFTAETMLAAQSREIEQTLARLLRTHTERAQLLHRMSEEAEQRQRLEDARRWRKRAREHEDDAEVVRRMVVALPEPEPADGGELA